MFQIPDVKSCTIRYFPSEDPTFDSDALTDDQLWQYYVASYTMTEATEGVDQSAMRPPNLSRNLAPQQANPDAAFKEAFGNTSYLDIQSAFVSPDTYKLILSGLYAFHRHGGKGMKGYEVGRVNESEKFREMFVRNNRWMQGRDAEFVEGVKAKWEKGVKEGEWMTREQEQELAYLETL